MRLLLAWTTAINLTGIREPAAVALNHVVDSLAVVPLLRARGITSLLDLGSGGGFPGLTIAAALPADRVLLVDSVAKKVGFLATVIEATGLGRTVAAEAVRGEALAHDERDREAWPAVTSRAVAALSELVEVGLPLVAPGGILVAWKRLPLDEELSAAGPALEALRAGRLEVVDPAVPTSWEGSRYFFSRTALNLPCFDGPSPTRGENSASPVIKSAVSNFPLHVNVPASRPTLPIKNSTAPENVMAFSSPRLHCASEALDPSPTLDLGSAATKLPFPSARASKRTERCWSFAKVISAFQVPITLGDVPHSW